MTSAELLADLVEILKKHPRVESVTMGVDDDGLEYLEVTDEDGNVHDVTVCGDEDDKEGGLDDDEDD